MNPNIKFTASGDVEEYLKRIKDLAKKQLDESISAARESTQSAKEQLNIIENQARATERRLELEKKAATLAAQRTRDSNIKEKSERAFEAIDNINGASDAEKKKWKDDALYNITKKENAEYKENTKASQEQYKETLLQSTLLRELIQEVKNSSKKIASDESISNREMIGMLRDEEDKSSILATELALIERGSKRGGGSRDRESVFGALVKEDILQQSVSGLENIGRSSTGIEAVNAIGKAASSAVGSTLGSIVTAFAGPQAGAVVAKFGSSLTDAALSKYQAIIESRNKVYSVYNRNRGLTGRDDRAMFDMSDMGIDFEQGVSAQYDVAKGYSNANDILNRTNNYIALQKGYGVDASVLQGLMNIQRGRSDEDVTRIVAEVLADPRFQKDRTFLSEYLQEVTSLQRQLLSTSSNVEDVTSHSIFSMFDKIGGQWQSQDFRSSENIGNIQRALSNPQGDNLKAMSFVALQRLNPGRGIADILEMQEGGLNTPGYFKSMLELVDQMGGDRNMQLMNLSGLLPGLSRSSIRELYEGYKNGTLDPSSIRYDKYTGLTRESDSQAAREEAQRNTTEVERMGAQALNATYKSIEDALTIAAQQIPEAIKLGLSGMQVQIITTRDRTNIKVNETKAAPAITN